MHKFFTCVLRSLFTLAFCLLATAALAEQEVVRDGILHIINQDTPVEGREVRQLEEVWRVGGDDDEEFFGLITQVMTDAQGQVFLLDTRLAEVPVYSADGERLNTLSREGDGPGETRMPGDLMFMPDGTIGLVQAFPGKIINIDLQGQPLDSFEVSGVGGAEGGFVSFNDARANGDQIIVKGTEHHRSADGQRQVHFLSAYDRDGQLKANYYRHEVTREYAKFIYNHDDGYLQEYRRWALGRDGRVYTLQDPNSYTITVYHADGSLDRVIERPYKHRLHSDEDYQALKEGLEGRILAQLPNAEINISKNLPDLAALRLGPDGNIWAETSWSGIDQPDGILFTWDVFSPDGVFLKQVSAQTDGDGTEELLLWVEGGAIKVTGFYPAVLALRNGGVGEDDGEGEATPMEVIYYRVAETLFVK